MIRNFANKKYHFVLYTVVTTDRVATCTCTCYYSAYKKFEWFKIRIKVTGEIYPIYVIFRTLMLVPPIDMIDISKIFRNLA